MPSSDPVVEAHTRDLGRTLLRSTARLRDLEAIAEFEALREAADSSETR